MAATATQSAAANGTTSKRKGGKHKKGKEAAAANATTAQPMDADASPSGADARAHAHAAPTANGKRRSGKAKRVHAEAAGAPAADADAAEPLEEEPEPSPSGDGELTLGERAAAMQLRDSESEGVSDAEQVQGHTAGERGSGAAAAPDFSADVSGRVGGETVVMLLKQALRGEDAALLQKCLTVDDERVVKASVRALTSDEVAALLQLLAQRLQSVQPGNKQSLVWAQHTLTQHAGYVASAPGLQPVLSSLYETIAQRTATLPTLLSLSGRLNLLLAQAADSGDRPTPDTIQPQVYYEESASDDDEGEVVPEDPYAPALRDASGDELGGSSDDSGLFSADEDLMEDGDDDSN